MKKIIIILSLGTLILLLVSVKVSGKPALNGKPQKFAAFSEGFNCGTKGGNLNLFVITAVHIQLLALS